MFLLIDDARCANDFQALGDFVNGGTAPVESSSDVWGLAGTASYAVNQRWSLKSISALSIDRVARRARCGQHAVRDD